MAFKRFCAIFRDAQYAHALFPDYVRANNQLRVMYDGIELEGKIDLLLLNRERNNCVLIDLKLKKYGSALSEFGFEDMLQVFVYALMLKKSGINVDSIGYYYFIESTIIYTKVSWITIERLGSMLESLLTSLKNTFFFKPKLCETCMVCPLKESCEIGQSVSGNTSEKSFLPLYF